MAPWTLKITPHWVPMNAVYVYLGSPEILVFICTKALQVPVVESMCPLLVDVGKVQEVFS